MTRAEIEDEIEQAMTAGGFTIGRIDELKTGQWAGGWENVTWATGYEHKIYRGSYEIMLRGEIPQSLEAVTKQPTTLNFSARPQGSGVWVITFDKDFKQI